MNQSDYNRMGQQGLQSGEALSRVEGLDAIVARLKLRIEVIDQKLADVKGLEEERELLTNAMREACRPAGTRGGPSR